jgi:selenocysteine-specific elongation factor
METLTENQILSPDKIDISLQPPLLNEVDTSQIFNINIGILGHVDSGKTTLSKKISTIASTASFDKNPQSKERGITLDLGFSALYIKTPSILKEYFPSNQKLIQSEYIQITLVDCPGHASLIKTVVAGSSIIDTMILVIDSMKGIQTQTVECILLSEILCDKICIALNKIDLLKKESDLDIKVNKLRTVFKNTKFGEDIPIVPISALTNSNNNDNNDDIKTLLRNVLCCIDFQSNLTTNNKEHFLAFVDHCFSIKNKGTIITSTIIKGNIKPKDEVYFPELSEKKQVKEMQMFKKPVQYATKGDRVGMLIKDLDSSKIERSIITSPNSGMVTYCQGGLFLVKKIRLFKTELLSHSKLYLMIGNQGVNAKCLFFEANDNNLITNSDSKSFSSSELKKVNINLNTFYSKEYPYIEQISNEFCFAFIKFDNKILVPNDMLFIGSKIDIDISQKTNRLAFYGKILDPNVNQVESKLKLFRMKSKEGSILRIKDDEVIVRGLFKKDNTSINNYIGKKVYIKQDKTIQGDIMSTFGQSGKLKIKFNKDLTQVEMKTEEGETIKGYKNLIVVLEYKKYLKLSESEIKEKK